MEEEKLKEAFNMLSIIKHDNPDIDLNYVVTGKKERVSQSGRSNFAGSDIEINGGTHHYENSVIIGCTAVDSLTRMVSSQEDVIRSLMRIIQTQKSEHG